MPYSIVREAKGVYVKWSGTVTSADFIRAVHEVNNAPDFSLHRYVINDTLECSGIDLTERTKEDAIAGAIGAHISNRDFVAAFVANDSRKIAEWVSVAKVANEYLKTHVFSDLHGARSWISTVVRD